MVHKVKNRHHDTHQSNYKVAIVFKKIKLYPESKYNRMLQIH